MKVKDRAANAADWSLNAASNVAASIPVRGAGRVAGALQGTRANDAPVVVVILAAAAFVAMILAMGLIAAWTAVCVNRGMYPAFDQPPIDQGGTWKIYCVD
ncbi:hypothetical protein [Nocardiopsis quinghaiensis]|uniref:hypothetical protein n=1 Tax=Nocardiopsis quinghaiensis TaxID=464995 RepID=UPI00123B6255|nr:hypothetical protein [Nocardiopsis quinghaiensis]